MVSLFGAIYRAVTGRSPKWPAIEKAHLKANPDCVVCGRPATEVHHVIPFHERPDLELDPDNLASVDFDCHLHVGHLGCWKWINRNFRAAAKLCREGLGKA